MISFIPNLTTVNADKRVEKLQQFNVHKGNSSDVRHVNFDNDDINSMIHKSDIKVFKPFATSTRTM